MPEVHLSIVIDCLQFRSLLELGVSERIQSVQLSFVLLLCVSSINTWVKTKGHLGKEMKNDHLRTFIVGVRHPFSTENRSFVT